MFTAYVNYIIWFGNDTEYNAAIALCSGNGYGHCPRAAATLFGITWPLVANGDLYTGSKGMYGVLPYGIPASPGVGVEIGFPTASGVFLQSDVDGVIVPAQAGSPVGGWPAGESGKIQWWGTIVHVNKQLAGIVPTTPIPQRRWIHGWEVSGTTPEGAANYTSGGARNASRTIEGYGNAIRGANSNNDCEHTVATFRAGLQPKSSWERFYLRVTTIGTNKLTFWFNKSAGGGGIEGASLRIDEVTGNLEAWNATFGPEAGTKLGETAIILGIQYLVDVIIDYAAVPGAAGTFRVYLNHSLAINGSVVAGGQGIARDTYHSSSILAQQSVAEANWEFDTDDWMCADVPNNGGVESLDSLDWLMGTHIRSHWFESGTVTDWAGVWEQVNQFVVPNQLSASALSSSTALATVEAVSDIADEQTMPGAVIGPASIWFASNDWKQAASNNRIGYSVLGGAHVYAIHASDANNVWNGNYYNPILLAVPVTVAPVKMITEKANDANSAFCNGFHIAVEYIGIWGKEDNPTYPIDLSNTVDKVIHNAHYLNIQHALGPEFAEPVAPCFAVGGTYVGNGGKTTIDLPAPAHFIWIRGVAGPASSNAGCKWFASGFKGNYGLTRLGYANLVTRSWTDSSGVSHFTVTQNNAASGEVNGAGLTYQYVAFCDPGLRFNYTGAFCRPNSIASHVNSIFNSTFTPQAGFIQEQIMNVGDNNVRLSYKGPGFAGNTGALLDSTAVANWGTFAAGSLTALADTIVTNLNGTPFSVWRTTDSEGFIFLQLTSYTGNGAADRTINLPLVSGRYPLFAMVLPHSGGSAFMCDPSHAGANSCSVDTLTNSATAIKGAAAPDTLDVGITLNANGVDYDVFVILGDVAGWNNGTFYPPITPSLGFTKKPFVEFMDGGVNVNGAATFRIIQNISGIYVVTPGKLTDTFYVGFGNDIEIVKIVDPRFKTGYIGG